MTEEAERGVSVSTIRCRLAAIKHYDNVAGAVSNVNHPQILKLMRGIARVNGRPPNRKREITLDILKRMAGGFGDDLRGKRDAALLLLGFWGAFRRSELVGIQIGHITFEDDLLKIIVPRSKTDKLGEGRSKTIKRLPVDMADVCAWRAIHAWLQASGVQAGSLFRHVHRLDIVGDKRIDPQYVGKLIKVACKNVGLEPRQFAGHSLRRGRRAKC
jgi:integrase